MTSLFQISAEQQNDLFWEGVKLLCKNKNIRLKVEVLDEQNNDINTTDAYFSTQASLSELTDAPLTKEEIHYYLNLPDES